jgi:hypothetical protein
MFGVVCTCRDLHHTDFFAHATRHTHDIYTLQYLVPQYSVPRASNLLRHGTFPLSQQQHHHHHHHRSTASHYQTRDTVQPAYHEIIQFSCPSSRVPLAAAATLRHVQSSLILLSRLYRRRLIVKDRKHLIMLWMITPVAQHIWGKISCARPPTFGR